MNEPVSILYVHGYLGSGNGGSSKRIRAELAKRGIGFNLDAPQFPVTDHDAMHAKLSGLSRSGEYDIVIASSLGAFYTMQHPGRFRILINPALPKDLKAIRDRDPENNKELTDELLAALGSDLKNFESYCDDDEEIFEKYYVFGDRDDVTGGAAAMAPYFNYDPHIFHVDMGHIVEGSGAAKVCDIVEMLVKDTPHYTDRLSEVLGSLFDE